jgi:copper transport protein
VYVEAAALWAGGLALLALLALWAGTARWDVAASAVPAFSSVAVLAVAFLLVAGFVNGLYEVGSWSALWETTYGRLLLVKVALVVPLVTLGVFQNRVSVPRLRSRTGDRVARHRFALVVVAELALMTGVIAVTTFLVAEPPAKSRLAAAAGPVSRDGQIGPYGFTVTVDPARVGTSQIHLYLLDSTGQLADVDEVALAATLPSVAVGPLVFQTTKAGPGHRVVPAAELPLPGVWQLQLDVREGEFSSWSASVDIPIRKDN